MGDDSWMFAAGRLAGCARRLLLFAAVSLTMAANARAAAPAEIFLRANQAGYRPSDVKLAVAFSTNEISGGFEVLEEDTRKIVFEGRAVTLSGAGWGRFTNHAELDFTALNRPGRYTLAMGKFHSLHFSISPDVYRGLPDQMLDFMREQRCDYNPFLDTVCHAFDGRSAYGPMTNGTYINARGGWHDAGDMVKYLFTAGTATAQLLEAYKLAPGGFEDRVNVYSLGEPATNGIPDVLDEARWGLEWMLKLHPGPDLLFHQVGDDRDHTGLHLPQNDTADYGWGQASYRVVYFADGKPQGLRQFRSSSTGVANLAGRYAAAMALAYQVWKDDPRMAPFAGRCLQAGVEVYELGQQKEGVQQATPYNSAHHYAETNWADDMEWGAAELYHATHKRQYLTDAKRYAGIVQAQSWMGRADVGYYQYYPFVNFGHFALWDSADRALKAELAGYYRQGIEACLAVAHRNPYRVGVPFVRCSNNLTVALATQIILYERMTGDLRYHDFLAEQRDWLLGRNPWGISMFTGIPAGGIYPHEVDLQTTRITKRQVRGGLVDGPVAARLFQGLKDLALSDPDPFAPFQDELAVYHDDNQDYLTNEPTVDGTASAILLWALCGSEK